MSRAERSLEDWLSYIEALHPAEIALGLERVRLVAERLNVRQPAPRSVIVAGTNGKGSTCVALETLLLHSRLRVGASLSPHIQRFNERIRIDGQPVADEIICESFRKVDRARLEQPAVELTYFEFATLAALDVFAGADLDVAILEVGLGGRLDAFNIVDADLAVVTSIGLDHQDFLGEDLEQIGREKAGVFRRGQPVVLGEVTSSVVDAAEALDCQVARLGSDFRVEESAGCWSYLPVTDQGAPLIDIPRGALAPSNCALAICAALLLDVPEPLPAGRLAEVSLEGRMQVFSLDEQMLIVDVAHNPAAAGFLAGQLRIRCPERRYVAILGALAGKDVRGIGVAIDELVGDWLTIDTLGARGQSAARSARYLAEAGCRVEACESISEALVRARSLVQPGDGILVLGSFFAAEQGLSAVRSAVGSSVREAGLFGDNGGTDV